jgi:hypothetical protein
LSYRELAEKGHGNIRYEIQFLHGQVLKDAKKSAAELQKKEQQALKKTQKNDKESKDVTQR